MSQQICSGSTVKPHKTCCGEQVQPLAELPSENCSSSSLFLCFPLLLSLKLCLLLIVLGKDGVFPPTSTFLSSVLPCSLVAPMLSCTISQLTRGVFLQVSRPFTGRQATPLHSADVAKGTPLPPPHTPLGETVGVDPWPSHHALPHTFKKMELSTFFCRWEMSP